MSMIQKIKTSFFYRMILVLSCILMIPLSISVYVTYSIFHQAQGETYIEGNKDLLFQAGKRMDLFFEMKGQVDSMVENSSVLSNVLNVYEADKQLFLKKLTALTRIYNSDSDIHTIMVYYPLTKVLYMADGANYKMYEDAEDIEQMKWYQDLMQTGNVSIEPLHYLDDFGDTYQLDRETPVVTRNSVLRSTLSSNPYAVISVNYKLDPLLKICNEIKSDETENIGFLDSKGALFCSTSDTDILGEDIKKLIYGKENASGKMIYKSGREAEQMLIYSKSEKTGYLLYKILPNEVVYRQANQTRQLNITIMAGIILIVIICVSLLGRQVLRPVKNLQNAMLKAASGDLKAYDKYSYKHQDEFASMSGIYNYMLKQINTLIVERYELQLAHRATTLKALQAQINPHFLTNTPQYIASDALEKGDIKEYQNICRLAKMMRYAVIEAGSYQVRLKDEFMNGEDYLSLQKLRFGERLEYRIELPKELEDFAVPKLFLQPIIENAVTHGLEPRRQQGTVKVWAEYQDDKLNIYVKDNGVGMDAAALKALREEIETYQIDTKEDKIGLGNIFSRIKMLMGEESRLEVFSGQDGTLVAARFKSRIIEGGQQDGENI
ncbi:MAG: histidine kinase [Clostridium sp.]|nr:histidine kinase [Clostridium sp.]